MKTELRFGTRDNRSVVRGLCLITETEAERHMLDEVFGSRVGATGLIGVRRCECRLSDGYSDHYIYITAAETAEAEKPQE